jgi:hypothetical protein
LGDASIVPRRRHFSGIGRFTTQHDQRRTYELRDLRRAMPAPPHAWESHRLCVLGGGLTGCGRGRFRQLPRRVLDLVPLPEDHPPVNRVLGRYELSKVSCLHATVDSRVARIG